MARQEEFRLLGQHTPQVDGHMPMCNSDTPATQFKDAAPTKTNWPRLNRCPLKCWYLVSVVITEDEPARQYRQGSNYWWTGQVTTVYQGISTRVTQ